MAAIIGDVQIQVAVPINVRQGHGRTGHGPAQAGLRSDLVKMRMAVIQKQPHSASHAADQQIEMSIPIHVGKDGPGRCLIGTSDSGTCGDILEFPVAQVAVEDISMI